VMDGGRRSDKPRICAAVNRSHAEQSSAKQQLLPLAAGKKAGKSDSR
jgi:hypothetical protein